MNVSSFDRQKGLIHPEGCIPFEPNHYEPQNVKVYVEKLFLYYVLLSILYYCVIASTVFWSFGRTKTYFGIHHINKQIINSLENTNLKKFLKTPFLFMHPFSMKFADIYSS